MFVMRRSSINTREVLPIVLYALMGLLPGTACAQHIHDDADPGGRHIDGPEVRSESKCAVDQMAEGTQAFAEGRMADAAAAWHRAMLLYRKSGMLPEYCAAAELAATAYESLGQVSLAVDVLKSALGRAESGHADSASVSLRARLGAALIGSADLGTAETLLTDTLQQARANQDTATQSAILNDLGRLYYARKETRLAIEAHMACAALTRDPLLLARAQTNAALAAVGGDVSEARALNLEALRSIQALPGDATQAQLLISAGRVAGETELLEVAAAAYRKAIAVAREINNELIAAYAWGYLGELYERGHRIDEAMQATRQASFLAQAAQSPVAIYKWKWQLGRLYRANGNIDSAIVAYAHAIEALRPIRNDLSNASTELAGRSGFENRIGAIFYEQADLLLKRSETEADLTRARQYLRQARDTVEDLKSVELEDYFRDGCINLIKSKSKFIDTDLQRTAVVYIIPLVDRTELLVSLPSGLKRYRADVTASDLSNEAVALRKTVVNRMAHDYLSSAQQMYDWIIRPIEGALERESVDTLVFVPDGELRAVPMSALHDRKQFLIARYAISVTPGLSLTAPQPIGSRNRIRVLAAGLSEAREGFSALPAVHEELAGINELFLGTQLKDEEFKCARFAEAFRSEAFTIVHVASHGLFSGNARDTFVLTSDGKFYLDDFEKLIQPSNFRGEPVELLTLSACQTAEGDDSNRAALGLAGVAVKAGARSALATLWSVDDQASSNLVVEFYRGLKSQPSISKAKALQKAQLKLLADPRYDHPACWAPYLLIGNWL